MNGPTSVFSRREFLLRRAELESDLVHRFWDEAEFREALRKDPRGALEGIWGSPIPEDAKVQVLEEDPRTYYLVIPPDPVLALTGVLEVDSVQAYSTAVAPGRPVPQTWPGRASPISGALARMPRRSGQRPVLGLLATRRLLRTACVAAGLFFATTTLLGAALALREPPPAEGPTSPTDARLAGLDFAEGAGQAGGADASSRGSVSGSPGTPGLAGPEGGPLRMGSSPDSGAESDPERYRSGGEMGSAERTYFERLAGQMSFEDALSALESMAEPSHLPGKEEASLISILRAHFEQDPANYGVALEWAKAPGTPAILRGALVLAIALSGRPGAEEELLQLGGSAELSAMERHRVIAALAGLPSPGDRTLDALGAALGDPILAHSAATSLGAIAQAAGEGPRRERIATALSAAMGRSSELDFAVVESLGQLGSPSARRTLVEAASHPDQTVREAAVRSLAGLSGEEVLAALALRITHDESDRVRSAAIDAAAAIGDPAFVELFGERAMGDPDPGVRMAALVALADRMDRDPEARAKVQAVAAGSQDEVLRALAAEWTQE